jgi:hypothetical protein
MPLNNIEPEDIALLAVAATAATAVLVDEVYAHPIFKGLKIVGVLLSLGLAVHRIRSGKPFYQDIPVTAWSKEEGSFRYSLPKSVHKRGKYPSARCLFKNDDGTYNECYADVVSSPEGNLTVRANTLMPIRVEVRK